MPTRFKILLAILFLPALVMAQDDTGSPDIIYNSQITGGFTMHSNGIGAFFSYGKYRGTKKVWLAGIDMLGMKHEKEIRTYNPVYEDGKSYIYGKINSFYVLRPHIGKRKIITLKERRSGVQFGYTWAFGPSLGITKPVYLEIGYPSIPYDYLAVERYDPDRHYFDDIYGRASGLRGLGELRLYTGAFAKFALNFEYSSIKDRLKGLEAGAVLDLYPKTIPIMAPEYVEKNRQYFLTFYLNIFFGRKYIQR